MIHRLASHLATVLALAAAIALVNYWWRLSAGFTLIAVPILYVAERTSSKE